MKAEISTISVLGSGWLGLPLIKTLVSEGHTIRASTRSESRITLLADLKTEPFIIDINNLSNNLHSFLKSKTLIINIPSKNIEGFNSLLPAIEKSPVEQVLFISSTSVYEANNQTVYESKNNESESSALFKIENLFRSSPYLSTTIIRFAGLIGYSRQPGRFFAKGKTVKDPDAFVNLIHRDDCIEIIKRILEKQVWGETFNCCADTHPTKREFYTKAAQDIGSEMPAFEKQSASFYKIISNQKVKKHLNYTFKHGDLMKICFPR